MDITPLLKIGNIDVKITQEKCLPEYSPSCAGVVLLMHVHVTASVPPPSQSCIINLICFGTDYTHTGDYVAQGSFNGCQQFENGCDSVYTLKNPALYDAQFTYGWTKLVCGYNHGYGCNPP
jgi:hypothetical protein